MLSRTNTANSGSFERLPVKRSPNPDDGDHTPADPELMEKLFGSTPKSGRNVSSQTSKWYIWDPLSRSRMMWEISIALLIIYGCLEIPFSIAFLKEDNKSIAHKVSDYTIDGIMLMDCFLTFFTGYVDADDHVTMNHFKIVRHYLRSWFAIDFLSALPIDQFTPVLRELRMVRVIRMVRMLRVQKLVRYIKRWEDQTSIGHSAIRLIQLILTSLAWIHLDACALFGVSSLQDFPEGSWVHGPPFALPVHRMPEPSAIFDCYTHSFFSALSNMLCVSYGLGGPTRTEEMWMFVISMSLGASMYALVLAFACNVMTSTDHASRLYQNSLETLNEFMRVRALPRVLRERLRRTLEAQYPNKRLFLANKIEQDFPAPLRAELRHAICLRLFSRTPVLSDAPPSFLSAFAASLSVEVGLKKDVLAHEGEILERVCFIEMGKVEVTADGEYVAQLGEGSYFGEITALGVGEKFGHEAGVATATVRSLDLTTMHSVPRTAFASVVARFPDVEEALQVVARLRIERKSSSKSRALSPKSVRRSSVLMGQLTVDDVHEYEILQDACDSFHRKQRRRPSLGLGSDNASDDSGRGSILDQIAARSQMLESRRRPMTALSRPSRVVRRHSFEC